MRELNYDRDKKIDPDALDYESLQQSELGMNYGKHFVECQDRVNRIEEKIKVVRAKLTLQATRNPDKYLGHGIKPTGPTIEAYYRSHPAHIKIKEEWLDAVHEKEMAEIAKWEIGKTRKEMIENLTTLYVSQYFAGPEEPRNLSFEKQRKQKEKEMLEGRINKKLNFKRTK